MIEIYVRFVAAVVLLIWWVVQVVRKPDGFGILAGAAILYIVLQRDFYLYFLGQAAFPCGPMQAKEPEGANTEIQIENLRPDSNVVYWAAESNDEIRPDPWKAYGMNTNSGVARTDSSGTVNIRVRKPASYNVPYGRKTLQPHIHYRVCEQPGMLGPVQTITVD